MPPSAAALLLGAAACLSSSKSSTSLALLPPSVGGLPVKPLTVMVPTTHSGGGKVEVTVLEAADHEWWSQQETEDLVTGQDADSVYGLKLWPGALAAAQTIADLAATRGDGTLRGLRVLELGCGNGLASLTAAALGCEDVLATDVSDRALGLTRVAADHGGFREAVRTARFDVLSYGARSGAGSGGSGAARKGMGSKEEAEEGQGGGLLPPADVVVVADLLYEPSLAAGVAARVVEAAARGSCVVVAGDPSRAARGDFLRALADQRRGNGDDPRCREPPSPRIVPPGSRRKLRDDELGRFDEQGFFPPSFTVALAALKWKSKRVEVAVLNSAAVHTGTSQQPRPQEKGIARS